MPYNPAIYELWLSQVKDDVRLQMPVCIIVPFFKRIFGYKNENTAVPGIF